MDKVFMTSNDPSDCSEVVCTGTSSLNISLNACNELEARVNKNSDEDITFFNTYLGSHCPKV